MTGPVSSGLASGGTSFVIPNAGGNAPALFEAKQGMWEKMASQCLVNQVGDAAQQSSILDAGTASGSSKTRRVATWHFMLRLFLFI